MLQIYYIYLYENKCLCVYWRIMNSKPFYWISRVFGKKIEKNRSRKIPYDAG